MFDKHNVPEEPLFSPSEYQELSLEEQSFLQTAYNKAVDGLRRNITPMGFSACSLEDNDVHGTDSNYRSVWGRDGAKVVIWSLERSDPDIRECSASTLRTLFRHQSPTGQIPTHVLIDTDTPEYSGVGNICGVDSVMWAVIAMYRYAAEVGDWEIVEENAGKIQRAMDWLSAHDSNNCGMLEIPEAGDWMDLFARSYHVLYDEVIWYRCLICYSRVLEHLGQPDRANDYRQWADHVREVIVRNFWPSTQAEWEKSGTSFTSTQISLGDSRYLVAELSPFSFSWRCDVYANILAYMDNLVDKDKAMRTFHFLWGVGANEPHPVKALYPPVQAGDPEWRSYFTVNLLNLPHHYHNGGIWPFIGALWVRYVHKLGMTDLARRELVKLARMCAMGITHEWEFNEWHHGLTGRPMGKAYQAWSCAGFIQACHDVLLDPNQVDDDVE
ncbi:Plant neutral invertase [Planctomycetes bacterium Pan216]|uniref:beta-fructofuranosidase n=1 Tax=Kolteria novifilia TaxID=2527975 RepID=A0A518B485_9BACT|nr:Plant neutral invertase [Planctomycetes bacterium Pan216]